MRWIKNLELKNKLVFLAAVSGTMALLMSCAGFVWHDLRLLRSAQIEDLRNKAEILAYKSSAIVASDQPNAAELLLAKQKAPVSVECVELFNGKGKPLASYPIKSAGRTYVNLPADHYSHRYAGSGELELFHPIIDRGVEIGVVYLKANMKEFYEQVRSHAFMIAIVTLCSLAVAMLFASMMQSLITRPILQLADAAKEITMNEDYAIRVRAESNDELGVLYVAFNRMVEKIQTSQAELKLARDELEHRVEERTRQLQEEIAQRERVQQEVIRAKVDAEEASEAKSRFLANMSHEIRTPLNGILGFTDYILIHDRNLHESDRHDYLRTIKKSGESLLVLINDILDLSKIEAGHMEYERIRFSPHDVINDVISILRPKAREKKLSLGSRWDGAVPESIESDPLRFRQLLLNLAGNAIKFSEFGGVEVVSRLDQANGKLVVDVIDTGIGISAETKQALFKPFVQGDSSLTRRFGGTGLGLSICHGIVKGLGGEILVSSEENCGSTFSFTIESGTLDGIRLLSHPPAIEKPKESDSPIQLSLRSKRILVAEDGETNRKLIQLILTRAGAEVVVVENGRDALLETRKAEFDLILMDMQMPIMDGYSAATELRTEGYFKPIVALTANAMRGDEERCIAAGCSEYLTKPIRQDLLLSKIHELIVGEEIVEPWTTSPSDRGEFAPQYSELPTDDASFAELVVEFIESARVKAADLHRARSANDDKQLSKLAHWMKGSGGMAGFPMLSELGRELEDSIECANTEAIDDGLRRIDSLVGQLQMP